MKKERRNSGDVEKDGPKRLKLSKNAKDSTKRLILVIDNAHLVPHRIEKNGDKYELLTEDHIKLDETTQRTKFKGKYDKYLPISQNFRPDLVHQCLLMLFDSPLNHAELLQVYIRTHDNEMIQIHRETRMPRTYKRFSHLMANFLVERSLPQVTTRDGPINLLRFLGAPFTRHIPPASRKIKIMDYDQELPLEKLSGLVEDLSQPSDVPVVIHIEATPVRLNIEPVILTSFQKPDCRNKLDLSDDTKVYCISEYPLTPTYVCIKVLSAFERSWNIL